MKSNNWIVFEGRVLAVEIQLKEQAIQLKNQAATLTDILVLFQEMRSETKGIPVPSKKDEDLELVSEKSSEDSFHTPHNHTAGFTNRADVPNSVEEPIEEPSLFIASELQIEVGQLEDQEEPMEEPIEEPSLFIASELQIEVGQREPFEEPQEPMPVMASEVELKDPIEGPQEPIPVISTERPALLGRRAETKEQIFSLASRGGAFEHLLLATEGGKNRQSFALLSWLEGKNRQPQHQRRVRERGRALEGKEGPVY